MSKSERVRGGKESEEGETNSTTIVQVSNLRPEHFRVQYVKLPMTYIS